MTQQSTNLTIPFEKRIPFSFKGYSENFDTHINQSIRSFTDLKEMIIDLSQRFIESDSTVLDIGCSEGSLLNDIYNFNQPITNTQYIGVDIENSFQSKWKKRKNLDYLVTDINEYQLPNNLSLVLSIFTFQFLSERYRESLLSKIYNNLIKGGGLIYSEKVLSPTSQLQNILEFIYYDYKRKNFSESEILNKEKDLRKQMKLTDELSLTQSFKDVGFTTIQPFWRSYNFIGYLLIK